MVIFFPFYELNYGNRSPIEVLSQELPEEVAYCFSQQDGFPEKQKMCILVIYSFTISTVTSLTCMVYKFATLHAHFIEGKNFIGNNFQFWQHSHAPVYKVLV